MQLLSLNLLYQYDEDLLISSEYYRPDKPILGIIVDNMAFGLREYKKTRPEAEKFLASNRLGSYQPVLAEPKEIENLMREYRNFNETIEILQYYGRQAQPLEGSWYLTNAADSCNDAYIAVGRYRHIAHSVDAVLSFRPALRLVP